MEAKMNTSTNHISLKDNRFETKAEKEAIQNELVNVALLLPKTTFTCLKKLATLIDKDISIFIRDEILYPFFEKFTWDYFDHYFGEELDEAGNHLKRLYWSNKR